ncbi:serine protease [Kangiella sp. TOML190]|uniref:trypsin-like serine peptidase n=1 Tax=Kangiella sp. TOML190 TaxID=2931351 RepID=UPI00203EADB9|nr:PKD domain-containing protein [Kangiella sp. TOML190]
MKKAIFPLASLALLMFTSVSAQSQESNYQVLPLSHALKSLPAAPELKIPALDMNKIAAEDKKFNKFEKVYRYAVAYRAKDNYSDQGRWTKADGQSIWRLAVNAENTHNLSFGFKNVFLPRGAQLHVYNSDHSQVIGPFTERDNNAFQELWTPLILGGKAVIEISVPENLQRYVSFDLTDINQGYRGIDKISIAKSGSCNIDVVCPVADPWRKEIRSVAHYSFQTSGGGFVCTGTLVNNTALDRKPYFLTANHCVSNQSEVSSMVFYWNFETSVCDGTPDGSKSQSQSGATLRATWPGSDMTLVELNSAPSNAFNVHWAGWDNNPDAPIKSVAIHHPAGDEKRISFDDDPATITNYSSDTPVANGSHLRIGAWDQGTTEGGSSGSAIWNPNHHIVGTLHGGLASCSAPNDPDWYGRVSQQWEGGGTAASQLKAWLDPSDSGAKTLDGTDACTAPSVTIATIVPNPAEVGEIVSFTSVVTGGSGSGYTYQWDFDGDGATDSTQANPTHTYSDAYTGNVSLDVTDSSSCSQPTNASIVVEFPNRAPVASVASSSLTANENTNVTLDASSSSDPDGDTLTYVWTQTVGPNVNLSGASSAQASFTAPDVSAETDLEFEVTVTDPDGLNSTATVAVRVTVNQAPTAAVASSSLSANEGATVNLNASSSSDPDGDTLSFAWTQTSGTSVTINNASSSTASFVAPQVTAATTLEFEVTVTDPSGESSTASVTVTVNEASSGGGGGGSAGFGLLALLGLIAGRRRAYRLAKKFAQGAE